MPTVATSASAPVANHDGERKLGPHVAYLRGEWDRRDWRNVPGPFYGAETDSCWMGRLIAPDNVLYEDDYGSEVVFRQPRNPHEVHLVLSAAWNDPFGGYACDGDDHWTATLVREWWADRPRLVTWIRDLERRWSASERDDERDNALALRGYADYLHHGLEEYLRNYVFWLEHRRPPRPDEALPDLK
ncbi:MAG: ferredoxin [Hamadaea sp.]|nr:ferredoxin [Hamadaea sp.]